MVERSQRALTLTELLFALVLLGILGSLALPGWQPGWTAIASEVCCTS